jgi:hypothetical protein
VGLQTFAGFKSELTAIVGNRTDLTLPRLITALNKAQDRIAQEHDFRVMQQYIETQTNYTGVPAADKFLPYSSSWKSIHSIVLQFGTDSRKLKQIPWRKFDRLYPSPESVAAYIPLMYSDWNQKLIFMPVPNAVYPLQVRVTLLPNAYSGATPLSTTSQFNGCDEVLLDFAAGYLWRGFGRYDKAQAFDASGLQKLQKAIKADNDRPDLDTAGSAGDDQYMGQYWANPFISGVL